MNAAGTYRTLASASEAILFKEKHSKFFGYAFPVSSEHEIKLQLETLRKHHQSANHCCYAWRSGTEKMQWRANDNGEPNNSAGLPIYGQIQSFDITNVLVAVVRYFGGVKLGVGGLISAYKTAAQMALEASEIVEKTIMDEITLLFDYEDMGKVMRIIRDQKIMIISLDTNLRCSVNILVERQNADRIAQMFTALPKVKFERN